MATILIIDDDPKALALCRQMLEPEGHIINVSLDGASGIEICRKVDVDLVITDILMPHKEGMETIVELREEFPDMGILAVSGGGHLGPDSYLPLAKRMGAHYTLKKPFTRHELLHTVEKFLGAA